MNLRSKKRLNDKAPKIPPSVTLEVLNRQRVRKINPESLEKIAAATLDDLKIQGAELGIVLVGAKEMASLNESFLGHEGPTDVITFDYSEPKRPAKVHGEIFICVSEAERQAQAFGTDWQSEVIRYIIHGILHLAGYDDLQPVDWKKMKREEERLVRKFWRP
ncbi:MAG TPA: rRNA maturation RNase YbeY [Candidatus Sulfotelmatobacter sp.]|nr:rRNA maturation RNase YbeY [Candidatus Sulfotelmatobacter sp.]